MQLLKTKKSKRQTMVHQPYYIKKLRLTNTTSSKTGYKIMGYKKAYSFCSFHQNSSLQLGELWYFAKTINHMTMTKHFLNLKLSILYHHLFLYRGHKQILFMYTLFIISPLHQLLLTQLHVRLVFYSHLENISTTASFY